MQVAFASSTALGAMNFPSISALIVMPFIDAVAARRSAMQLAERAGCDGLILPYMMMIAKALSPPSIRLFDARKANGLAIRRKMPLLDATGLSAPTAPWVAVRASS